MEDDVRQEELSTITAIYLDELTLDQNDPFTFTVELSVSLSKPLVVRFPAASGTAPTGQLHPTQGPHAENQVDSHELTNLPSLHLRIHLPEGYPEKQPPQVLITTSPPWLPSEIVEKLQGNVKTLWEEIGHDQVIFTYIDVVQQSVENVFGLVGKDNTLEVGPEHKIAILDYDIEAKRRAFEKGTFDCGICLDPKKGSVCHRMIDCGHIFCVQCLQDFYNNAITEGSVASVRCLEPNCAETREKAARDATSDRRRKPKMFINPSELLQIPLEQEMVKRYVTLKHKSELESDKNTVYCPRSWCQGAARSKRHKKPEGLEFAQDTEESEDDNEENTNPEDAAKIPSREDLLAICEDCGFAFCSRCGQSWHGAFKYCIPKERRNEISEEEKASLEYLQLYTTPCPTCAAPCQKTQGCNHMKCFRCHTHFCYLCSAWLNPENPYQHFNTQPKGDVNGCYMRLWELEGGDGDDVGIAYEGGNALRRANIVPGQYGEHLEIVAPRHNDAARAPEAEMPLDRDLNAAEEAPRQEAVPARPANQPVAVAREGPLVLRIEGNVPPVRRDQPPRPPPPAAAHDGHQRGRGRGGFRGRGAAAGANRQQNRAQAPNQRPPRNGRAVGQNVEEVEANVMLNQADEDWVRHFVQLALHDQEHLIDWDSDDDEV
ncbi:RWD domain-containing protein [Xylariales sp. PMI_506]|nr:RWD domain-containing protein [Xylariales sp. PMI_506]